MRAFLRIVRLLAILCALVATLGVARAEAQQHSRVWLGAGLGGAAGANADGGALLAQLVFQRAPHHFALRGVAVADPFGAGDALGEVGVLYGRARVGTWGHAALAAGVALTIFDGCAGTDDDTCVEAGVPLVAEAALRLNRALGVGVQAFGNLNGVSHYGGAIVFLQLGALR